MNSVCCLLPPLHLEIPLVNELGREFTVKLAMAVCANLSDFLPLDPLV